MSELSSSSSPLAWIAGVGASAGHGAALPRRFAREAFTVVLTGRTAERVDVIADSDWHLHSQSRSAWTQELDLRPWREPF